MTTAAIDTNISRRQATKPRASPMTRLRRTAWILVLVAEAGMVLWGLMAALVPQYLPGPGGTPIVIAGYEGFTHDSWSELSPFTADFITLVFRMFGALCATFGIVAMFIAATAFRRGDRWAWWALLIGNTLAWGAPMTYDRVVNAIGLFEMTEYLGIGLIYLALIVTAPFRRKKEETSWRVSRSSLG